MTKKQPGVSRLRLDALAQQHYPHLSRQQVQGYIVRGDVLVDGIPVTKAGFAVPVGADIVLRGESLPFVSRGGLKLVYAFEMEWLKVEGCCCADVGASTGGFTDCLLQQGALRVHAIDVGHGQLHDKIRHDPRVVVYEKTNVRSVAHLPEPISVVVVDVSFISLRTVLPVVKNWLATDGSIVALFKPQFEAGKKLAHHYRGVISDESVRQQLLDDFFAWLPTENLVLLNMATSPITGPKGNVEYLMHLAPDRISSCQPE